MVRTSVPADDDRNLRHLVRVHEDTLQQCLRVTDHPAVFRRWSKPDQRAVSSLAEEVRSRHATGLERWTEFASSCGAENDDEARETCQESLQAIGRILQRRLGIQLLCDQLVKLGQGRNAVAADCDLSAAVREAYTEAAALCDSHWQVVPELEIHVHDPSESDGTFTSTNDWEHLGSLRAAVIRPWLHHALVELFKNAMNASVLQALRGDAHKLRDPLVEVPRLTVRVRAENNPATKKCGGDSLHPSILIDIRDRGVGLRESSPLSVSRMFILGAARLSDDGNRRRWDRLDVQQSYAAVRSPLHGLGVGLPVSRLMMRHFGGDLTLHSTQNDPDKLQGGGGCLARIHIPIDPNLPEPDAAIRFEK
jgi:pyruvate dehydrogenase kinase 2/3/4